MNLTSTRASLWWSFAIFAGFCRAMLAFGLLSLAACTPRGTVDYLERRAYSDAHGGTGLPIPYPWESPPSDSEIRKWRKEQKQERDFQRAVNHINTAAVPRIKPPAFKPPTTVASTTTKTVKVQPAAAAPAMHPPKASCFIRGTLVHTPKGPKEIQDIRAGNLVLSLDDVTKTVEPARVLQVIKGKRADLIRITSAHGTILCSQNHPFFTGKRKWVEASMLRPNQILLRLNASTGELGPVLTSPIRCALARPVHVYDLRVEKNANYFVGPDAILCHNKGMKMP